MFTDLWRAVYGWFGSFGTANHHLIDQVARTPAEKCDFAVVMAAHTEYCKCLSKAEEFLATKPPGSSFLADRAGRNEFTIADIPLGVELNRWSLCVHAAQWRALGGGGAAEQLLASIPPMPRLQQYYAELLARPAFREQVFELECQHQQLEELLCAAGGSKSAIDRLPQAMT